MNAFSTLLLLFVVVTAVWGAIREKRQHRTVIERTVANNYGGHGFNRQPWGYGSQFGGHGGGIHPGWGSQSWGGPGAFNRGPFGGPPPPTVVKTTVIRHG